MNNLKSEPPSLLEIREAHSWKREYERHLLASRFVFRPAGFLAAWACVRLGLSSEMVSWLSGAAALGGFGLLLSGRAELLPAGIALLQLFNLLDCVDGSIARVMKTENPYGRFLDSLMTWVDIGFWAVVGAMVFRRPELALWPEPFGWGPLAWAWAGVVTAFLWTFIAYVEQIFDSLLRADWNELPEAPKPDISGRKEERPGGLGILKGLVWKLNHNLRVRETYYLLLIVAYWARTIDLLVAAYLVYYLLFLSLLIPAYCARGRKIREMRLS